MPEMPEDPTIRQEEKYFDTFAKRVQALAEAGGRQIREMERRIRDATKRQEKTKESPTVLFHYLPGQLVLRRQRTFSKLEAPTSGPFRARSVTGAYRQRVLIEPVENDTGRRRRLTVHASQLVPYD